VPAPRTVLVGAGSPPTWILLEWLPVAVGPAEEVLGMDHVFELLRKLRALPTDRLLGRRDFPLDHWHPVSYIERIRAMYESVLPVVGDHRWRNLQMFLGEAVRWTDGRPPVVVHGDFCEQNIVVDHEGQPHLVDFERVGMGNPDHDIAWFWIHSTRNQDWKRQLVRRWLGERVGGDRIRAEWGIRATLALLAVQRLRFGHLAHGEDDPRRSANLALLDAALSGGRDLFPG
jgi:aminoglycoside phosphotransferase (APT) family kinase protein